MTSNGSAANIVKEIVAGWRPASLQVALIMPTASVQFPGCSSMQMSIVQSLQTSTSTSPRLLGLHALPSVQHSQEHGAVLQTV